MYDHYISIDWAQENMAVARMTTQKETIQVFEGPADVKDLQVFLSKLRGTKIMTLEESTTSQWLYTELREHVDRLVICDPHRNHLLSEGHKNDKIDSKKLVQLLRADMLKEVFHSGDEFIYFRKICSGYEDLIRSGVQAKNQRSALFRAVGKNHKKDSFPPGYLADQFVLERLNRRIEDYEAQKSEYEAKFIELARKHKPIHLLKSLPGIGDIHAVQIVAWVVDVKRFKTQGRFLSYAGLVKHERMSGGKSYGRKASRCNRAFKNIFKMATFSVIQERAKNPFRQYYDFLIHTQKIPDHIARSRVARKLALITYGILKSGNKFNLQQFGGKQKATPSGLESPTS